MLTKLNTLDIRFNKTITADCLLHLTNLRSIDINWSTAITPNLLTHLKNVKINYTKY